MNLIFVRCMVVSFFFWIKLVMICSFGVLVIKRWCGVCVKNGFSLCGVVGLYLWVGIGYCYCFGNCDCSGVGGGVNGS